MIPVWLHDVAIGYLSLGALCTFVVAADLFRHRQNMWIMNVVWPTVALFGSGWIVWQYFAYGRLAERTRMARARERGAERSNRKFTPFPLLVANGALHCGSGCTWGDIVGEWLVAFAPIVAVWFGWHSVFGDKVFATWMIDDLLAYAFGIVFQYFTIAPMRGLSVGQGLWAAVKADTLSLTAWQVGMYGFMAFANFYVFRTLLDVPLEPASVEFWFFMQLAMICGFATAYPVNLWLIRQGLKELM